MTSSTTDRVRIWNMGLWSLTVVLTLVGWMAGKDPGALTMLLTFQTAAMGIGEGSNIGKRATYNPAAKDAER